MAEKETVGQWLGRLATTNESTDEDSDMMQNLLHRIGKKNAIVVLGIVYIEGRGTIEQPPIDIHSVAKEVLNAMELARKAKEAGCAGKD